jgi:hypothetical protein
MSVLNSPADRCYPISHKWLTATGSDVPDYVDVREIRGGKSKYVKWVMANDPGLVSPDTVAGHKAAMNFTLNGISVGDTNTGTRIEGILSQNTFKTRLRYLQGFIHAVRYSRIYRKNTSVRHIAFMGYSA